VKKNEYPYLQIIVHHGPTNSTSITGDEGVIAAGVSYLPRSMQNKLKVETIKRWSRFIKSKSKGEGK
jgi:hypothetical protein